MLSCGVSSAVEINSGAVNFTFLRAQHSFKYVEIHILEGTGLLSSPHRGEQSRSERNAPSLLVALAGGGATAMQCHDIFRGAKLPRSNQKRGQQASEHDRNHQYNAATVERHRQAIQISTPTAGVEDCIPQGMSHTRSHANL